MAGPYDSLYAGLLARRGANLLNGVPVSTEPTQQPSAENGAIEPSSSVLGPQADPQSYESAMNDFNAYAKQLQMDAEQQAAQNKAMKIASLSNFHPQVNTSPLEDLVAYFSGNNAIKSSDRPESTLQRISANDKLFGGEDNDRKLALDALKTKLTAALSSENTDVAKIRALAGLNRSKSGGESSDKPFINSLQKDSAKATFGYTKLKPVLEFLDNPNKTDSDKAKMIFDNLKIFNDVYGSDATGVEEVKRLASDLNVGFNVSTGKFDPTPDVKAAIERARNKIGVLKNTVKETREIIKAAKGGNLEKALELNDEPVKKSESSIQKSKIVTLPDGRRLEVHPDGTSDLVE